MSFKIFKSYVNLYYSDLTPFDRAQCLVWTYTDRCIYIIYYTR